MDISAGDRVIISASAIPGNEKSISNIINELYRKGADVVYDKREGPARLRPRLPGGAENHPRTGKAQVLHPRPRRAAAFAAPRQAGAVHGHEPRRNIHHRRDRHASSSSPRKTCKVDGTVPAGRVFVDGSGVGDVGSVVLRDRKHLAEDGMIVVCVNLSSEDGSIITGPDIITRGFIYVKESEELMDELKEVAMEAIDRCQRKRVRDWSAIKSAIKNDLSGYLYKTTKRNPMILPVIMEI